MKASGHDVDERLPVGDSNSRTLLELVLEKFPDTPRKRAKEWILAGRVSVAGTVVRKPNQLFDDATTLQLQGRQLATLALDASLPSGFRAAAAGDAISVKPETNPFLAEDGSLHWTMQARRSIVQSFDSAQVTQLVQGYGVKKAQSNLDESLPSATSPKIQLSPSWWQWVPVLPFRIEVVTE